MTYGSNPPGGYEDPPPGGYANAPGGYGNQPGGHGNPPEGYGDQPGGYGNQPGGYGNQPGGYGNQPGGYSNQPGGYGNQPGGYGNQPGGYENPPGGYGNPQGGYYEDPAAGYGNPRGGYGAPGGYGNAPAGYGAPGQAGYGSPAERGYGAPGSYANWGQRVGAYLIDSVPGLILVLIGNATGSAAISLVFDLIALGISGYNRWYQAGRTGQSWGRRVLGISLLSEATGQPVGAGAAFLRDICHIADSITCYVGFLFPLWDAKRQTFADKIMRTVVVPAR
jgi:uncharacterized RDD family membrane protein YckC